MIFLYKYLGFFFLLLSLLTRTLSAEAKWCFRIPCFLLERQGYILQESEAPVPAACSPVANPQLPAAQLVCTPCLAALRIRPLIAAFRSITFVPVLSGIFGRLD